MSSDRFPFAVIAPIWPARDRPFGTQTLFFLQASQWLHRPLFLFSDEGGQPDLDRLCGWRYEDGRLAPAESSIPPVIYDRRIRRRAGDIEPFRNLVRRMHHRGVRVLNHPPFAALCGDKLASADFFARHSLPSPPCRRLADPSGDHVQGSGRRFLKPRYGYKGSGILLWQCGTDPEILDAAGKRRASGRTEVDNLLGWLRNGEEYLVQDEIPVLRLAGRRFDLRLLVQRDGAGQLALSGGYLRVAADTATLVSNLAAGAELQAIESLKDRIPELESAGRALCRRLVAALEVEFINDIDTVLEFGIDLLVDEQGELHVLEINSKPGRSFHRLPGSPRQLEELRRSAVLQPFEYLLTLR